MAEAVRAERGALDILVNNAGIGHVGTIGAPPAPTSTGSTPSTCAASSTSPRPSSGACSPGSSGAIVNIASIGGVLGIRDRLAYCTTKFAVVGMTKALAIDHAKQGIRVNCVCPGRVETPFVKARLQEYADPEEAYRQMASSQAVGRMGTPEEIAAAVLYLASDEAKFVTGSALIIDGGWSAG